MPSYSGIFTLPAQMQAKAAGNWPSPPPPVIGQAFGGGFFAGAISTTANSVATHYLVIGPKSSAEISNRQWKNDNTAIAGADSAIDGPQNTADMIADGSATVYPAAHFCNNLVTGGFDDWYMPARNEIEICYFNLKPTTSLNNEATGINVNAVPARASNYTSGNPAQTPIAEFQANDGAQHFSPNNYWSSTEFSANSARFEYFQTGTQGSTDKTSTYRVRAVRRVPV